MSLNDLEKMIEDEATNTASVRPIVVVIDDDESVRSSLSAVLQDEYDVRSCENAVEGVRQVDEATDCIILDVKMPVHDGFWVAKQLRDRDQDLPIIFFSAYQNLKNPYEVINEFRPFGYVIKGDDLAHLLDLVASAVRHSKRTRDRRQTHNRLRDVRDQMRGIGTGGKAKLPESPSACAEMSEFSRLGGTTARRRR